MHLVPLRGQDLQLKKCGSEVIGRVYNADDKFSSASST
jgi:hypothetical protein